MTVRKDGQSGREWPDHPAAIEDLKPFNCPFSGKVMDWFQGGCPHFVFSFEMVNCEYLTVDRDFEKLALKHFHDSGYKVQKLPCPLEPWAECDDGDETRELPSLDKVVPGLKLIS